VNKRKAPDKYNGLLLIDKPLGMTSHDVVQKLRRLLNQKKIGHVGTLDPLATGLLVLCLGSGGKIARFLTDYDKIYEAQIRLGIRSETYDAEAVSEEQINAAQIPKVTRQRIDNTLDTFVGEIKQQAPAFSAIKVNGQPLYRSARKGEQVTPPVRNVTIYRIDEVTFDLPHLSFTVSCSKGTYIRSLAHDIGERLGCGAYLSGLRRTTVGKLSPANALTLEDVERLVESQHLESQKLQEHIIGPVEALDLPSLIVSDDFALRVADGLRPSSSDIEQINGDFNAGAYVLLVGTNNAALAVGVSEVDSREITTTTRQPIYRHVRVM